MQRALKRYLVAPALCLGLTGGMLALRPALGLAAVALTYLLAVFLTAVWWGRGPSLLASILSFFTLNFFFTVPYNTFFVAAPQDIVSLVVFLFVAEMTSRLVAGAMERVRLKDEAAEAQILRKTDELKSALLSAVSHDLRTPLASIRVAATGLLQDGFGPNDLARRELLQTIDAEAARLARLVSNLLDLSRIEAGVLKPSKEWRDLQEVVARAVDSIGDRLRDHRLVVEIPSTLPLVPLDFTQIEDVLVNLLDNAVRHSPEGTTIRVSGAQRGHQMVVQIENAGLPVPVESADQIFSRFYRVQRDRRGLGLGLAICKGLVEAHGGRIWVERPGEPGARFVFALPLEEAPASFSSRG